MFHGHAAFILVSNLRAVGPRCEGGPKDGLFPSNPLDYGAPCAVRKVGCFSPPVAIGPSPELCTACCFKLIMHASVGWWFSGVFPG